MLEKTKYNHSPGPLHVSEHDDNSDVVIRNEAGAILANCTVDTLQEYGLSYEDHQGIILADAHLFATSPELLEVCIEVEEQSRRRLPIKKATWLELCRIIDKARGRG